MIENLYHVTDNECLPKILEEGLIPKIGLQSCMADEVTPSIYLCRYEDVGIWRILLNKDIVLEVKDIDTSSLDYMIYGSASRYIEYVSYERISPEKISQVSVPCTADHMNKLCKNQLYTISRLVVDIIKYYLKDGYYETTEMLKDDILRTLNVLNNLDYNYISNDEIIKVLKDIGDSGEYTFVDTYRNTDIRLYQQIKNFAIQSNQSGDNILIYPVISLCNWIINTFDNECLTINTGGYIN